MSDLRDLDRQVAELLQPDWHKHDWEDTGRTIEDYASIYVCPKCKELEPGSDGEAFFPHYEIEAKGHPNNITPDTIMEPEAYSSDPAACAIVKDWLRDQGIYVTVEHMMTMVRVTGHRIDGSMPDDAKRVPVLPNPIGEAAWKGAPTEEEAVCRFALAVREVMT